MGWVMWISRRPGFVVLPLLFSLLWFLPLSGCTTPNPSYRSTELDGEVNIEPDGSIDNEVNQAPDGTQLVCEVDDSCTDPPGVCHEQRGQCDPETGHCLYDPLKAGTPCLPDDKCTVEAVCNGEGSCVGKELVCLAPHASSGTCVEGECEEYLCDPGFENCNGSWSDGCEVDLTADPNNCGGCNSSCPNAPNANASCEKGHCALQCSTPYEDCNEDPTDGCEIPVGQPNSCDRNGLTTFSNSVGATPGCGTPYCGKGTSKWSESFGTWRCSFCNHCQLFADGGSWCIVSEGQFSSERCEDCCDPASPLFPQVCSAKYTP